MKKLCTVLLGWSAAACLIVGAAADVVWNPIYEVPGGWFTVVAVIAVIIVTIILIRRNGEKK
ncbi:MAG: hypothetical protein LKJ86_10430 [Oscillibacter sp.]|jgi:hypothetical protein|nr:hypothetical protein [Oscillibacter sp.]